MDQQITFTVIGGFLGAGKTSFVNRLLKNADEIRFAILVNDFGALNIDQSLIASQNSQIIQLSNGCICCSLAGGLVDAMVSLMEWREQIDHILIEASGVSYPGRIMDFARIDPELRPGLTLVLVDAANMPLQLNDPRLAEVIAAQMRDADLFLLTKTDIAGNGEVTQTYDYLATHQSQAPVVVARADDPDVIALLLSDNAISHLESRAGDDRRLLLDQSHNDWPHTNFVSAAMSTTAPIEEAAFRSVCSDHSHLLVRGKGFVRFADGHYVWQQSGRRTEFHRSGPAAPTDSRIVLIANNPIDAVVAAFAALGFQPLEPKPISSAK